MYPTAKTALLAALVASSGIANAQNPTAWEPVTNNFLQTTVKYAIFPPTITVPPTITPTTIITQTVEIAGGYADPGDRRTSYPPLTIIDKYYASTNVPASLKSLATSITPENTTAITYINYFSLYRPTAPAFCTDTTWDILATTWIGQLHQSLDAQLTPIAVNTFGPIKDDAPGPTDWTTWSVAYLLGETALPAGSTTPPMPGATTTATTKMGEKESSASCAQPTQVTDDGKGYNWAATITADYISRLPHAERVAASAAASASEKARREKEREDKESGVVGRMGGISRIAIGLGVGLGILAVF